MTVITFDVIITTYRRPQYVMAAINSCLSQGQHLKRVIVVDDASRDGTVEMLRALCDSRVHVIERVTNGGIPTARGEGLRHSDADWSMHIDDDWELAPNALGTLAKLAGQANPGTVMIGGRILWDTGLITPKLVPKIPINYIEQLDWRSSKDGLILDNICCISRHARSNVSWPIERFDSYCSSYFYLNVAILGESVYTTEILGMERMPFEQSVSRGNWEQRFSRRILDASSGVRVADLYIKHHGEQSRIHGKRLLAGVYRSGAQCCLLDHKQWKAIKWAFLSCWYSRLSMESLQQLFGVILGYRLYKLLYRIRG